MIDVGQTVGNYNITEKLGEGGMGMVFLAEHPVIGSKVALKAIHPHLARNADVVSRFVTEARAVNQIEHRHIVNITDFGSTPAGDFYFIMEHLQGEMLSDGIARGGALLPARALNIAAQIADALQASHDQGVIHRDLKPDNVYLITRDDTLDFVKVLDFGLAKLTPHGGATPTHNTGPGMVMGTPYYMSPEQCEGKTAVDHRADIYSLGVILFEMLTGSVPFGGSGYGEVIIKHVTRRPPAARTLMPDLPPAIDAIVSRALAKDPSERFQSMAAFREALLDPERYVSALPAPVEGESPARLQTELPAAKTEMDLGRVSGCPTLMLGPPPSSASTSSLRQGDADPVDDVELKPKRSHRGLVLVGFAALAAVAITGAPLRQKGANVLAGAVARVAASAGRVDLDAVRGKTNRLLAEAVALARPSTANAASAPEIGGTNPADVKNIEPVAVAGTASPSEDPPITVRPAASIVITTRAERPRQHARVGELAPPSDDADATLPPSAP